MHLSGQIKTFQILVNIIRQCLPIVGGVVTTVRCMNEANPCRARLVLGRVTVFGQVYHLSM